MERLSCPACGGTSRPAGEKQGRFRPRDYRLAACERCGSAWVVDPDDDYAAIYDTAYYEGRGADPSIDYAGELHGKTARIYEWQGLTRIAGDLGVAAGSRWLDFGAGTGAFVRYLQQQAFEAFAFDTGSGIAYARQIGVPVLAAAELPALDGTMDVVTAIEVFEHLPEPLEALHMIARLLRPGGVCIATTGNVAVRSGRLADWSYVLPEVHVTFFSPSGLSLAYRAAGLEPLTPARSSGWNSVIRYKVLKTLGVGEQATLEQLVPWPLVAPFVDRLHGVSAMPLARKPA